MFEVIDLINRDYPRGGIAQPGLTAGTCLRKDFTFSEERSAAPGMLLAVSRVNESVPLFLRRRRQAPRSGTLADRRVAVLGLAFKADTDDERDSLAHKLIRLLERELADVVVARPARGHADGLVRAGRCRAPTWWSWPPTTPSSASPRTLAAIAALAARGLPGGGPVELLGRRPGVRLRLRARSALGVEPGMSRVLVTGGAGTIGAAVVRRLLADPAYEVRVSDQRPAPQWMREGCEVHTGDLRELAEARAAIDGLHARRSTSPRSSAGSPTSTASRTRSRRSTTRSTTPSSAPRSSSRWSASRTSPPRWCSSAPREFPTHRGPPARLPRCRCSAYGFSKLTGEVYCRAAHDEHGLPYTICRPFNAYGPGELPDAEPGIAHAVPDLISKVLSGQRPLQIFGSGEQTRTLTHVDDIADGIVTAMGSPAGLNEDFNISASRELTVAEIARIVWEACGEDPDAFALEHLPSFTVDVQRRWPSVEKARALLGWEARIGVEEGIAATVELAARARGREGSARGVMARKALESFTK